MSLARRTSISILKDGRDEGAPSKWARATALHQPYLDALPIPAAILDIRDEPGLACLNLAFESFILDTRTGDLDPRSSLFRQGPLREHIELFRESTEAIYCFDWLDGEGIGSRHFKVSFSRVVGFEKELILTTLIDRTAAVEAERSLRAEMLRDSLTGLPNRTAFIENVDAAIDDGNDQDFAILIVDLTRFSRVNESMGSLAGDELIITVARRLVSALRAGDVLARLAGDEFGILLKITDGTADTLRAARRIHAALLTPFRLSELEIRIDCAIGCAMMNDTVSMSEDLVRNAQVALKRAKLSGRVEIYQQGEVAIVRRRFSMETELRRAIENGDLTMAFQPLIDLQAGSCPTAWCRFAGIATATSG